MLLVILVAGCGPGVRFKSLWSDYQARFIQDGRVIDTGNGNISHSEGQGYGMLLAVAAKDRIAFDRLWQWTRVNLQVRQDRLFMWRRRPGTPLAEEDPNTASDGDLLIAWALIEAAKTWQDEALAQAAREILVDLKRTAIRTWQGKVVLLPGAFGFERPEALTLNLSYWVFPAFRRFAEEDPDPLWSKLIASGIELLHQARFGAFKLPPDWLETGEALKPWRERPPRFGYDAVRIPLYLIWSGYQNSDLLKPYASYWQAFGGFIPPWIDLEIGCVAAYPAPAGTQAIAALTRHKAGQSFWFRPPPPDQDYYSATLVLLSHLAANGKP
ncbi:MAG: glycosyl hydrolase family 8 [Methylohalobius sp.]